MGLLIVYEKTATASENEWYNDSDKEWQRVVLRVPMKDNEWQQVITNDNEWQRMTTSDTTNKNEWEQVK